MGKTKAKRRGLSESASTKGTVPIKKHNPFEMHVNRQKFNVIGRKLKSERGLPGISRSRAMTKRKATLLQEYKIRDKSNKFFDRRIGEKNREMTHEDRVVARFTAERMKMFNKKQIYNLADDEILTHRGQTLSEIEKFEDTRSDDDDNEDLKDSGKLGDSFVEDAHFGGGSESGDKKSHKDLIAQLIAESKKRKAEKQSTRAETLELTEQLDTEWQDLLPIMASSKKKPTDTTEVEKPDSYDVMMRELKFEARVKASDPLKTEEEIQEEEKRKRVQLEEEREKRMLSDGINEQSYKYRSADDLDDGFAIDDEPDVAVSYDFEGNIQLDDVERTEIDIESTNSVYQPSSSKEKGTSDQDEENDDCGNDGSSNTDEGETDDSLSDLKPTSESETEQEEENSYQKKGKQEGKQCNTSENSINSIENISQESLKEIMFKVEEIKERKNSIMSAERPIITNVLSQKEKRIFLQEVEQKYPNFSNVPEKYETLQRILQMYNAEKQGIIVLHIMDKNHISLDEMNRSRLETLFRFLLQHLDHLSSQSAEESLKVLNYVAPLLYDLAHLSPENASQSVLEVIKKKQEDFQKRQHKYPAFNTLIFFKVVSLLFPTSDFRHPVVTPSIIFMCQMLFQCRIKSRKDISAGLFLVTMFLEFTVLSKRFSPSAINFLCGVLHLAIPKTIIEGPSVVAIPPFRRIGDCSNLIVLESSVEDVGVPLQMKISDLSEETIDTCFKVRALATALAMLSEFLSNLGNLQACPSMFHCASVLLSKVPVEKYPRKVQSEIEKLSVAFQNLKEKTLQFLVVERKRPKALRLYEPKIESCIYDGKRIRPMGPTKMEKEKLLHKIKREKKSALREIRRDNSFLSKLKWKETIQSDKERFQKVKEIFGGAATQLGEIRALERKKKYMK